MQISNNTRNLCFGKFPVMTCTVKSVQTKEKNNATLYKMNIESQNDMNEIKYSKTGHALYSDFKKDFFNNVMSHDYYLLKNDKTDEVICAAETSKHYRQTDDKTKGFATVIDELSVNSKYNNAAEPVLANIVKEAYDRADENVISSLDNEERPELKRAKFSKHKNGDWILPQKRFSTMLSKAEEHSQIEYFV